jgi:LacI family transcriptional regulator
MRDIAEATGLSRSAVSLALRNSPQIPETTRRRVREAAEALGYKPNPLVSALMAHMRAGKPTPQAAPLALITAHLRPSPWQYGAVTLGLFKGLTERGQQRGYRIEEFWLREPKMTAQRLSRILHQRNVQGVIICPIPRARGHLTLDWNLFASVSIGYSLTRPVLHRVIGHHVHAVQIAMRKLRHLGYSRIGLAMADEQDVRVDRHFSSSYLGEQWQLPEEHRVVPHLADRDGWTASGFKRWFAGQKPQAILTVDAYNVEEWLQSLRARVPVISLYCRLDADEEFHGIHQNDYAIGAAAIDLLVDQLSSNHRGIPAIPRTTLVEPIWVDGAKAAPLETNNAKHAKKRRKS